MPADLPAIPRWRIMGTWREGKSLVFKSKRSEHNNLQICYRPYAWNYKLARWGIRLLSDRWTNQRSIVIDLGAKRCISIHITPRHIKQNGIGSW